MYTIYSDQVLILGGVSLFLAGPTPRNERIPSWRPEAVLILKNLGFTGTVLIPERQEWCNNFDYIDQVEWEFAALERANVLLFWVPRDADSLPGFTTNVEFGRYVGSGRMVYGRPDGRPHNHYLDWLYNKLTGDQPYNNLSDTIRGAIKLAEASQY